MFPLKNLSERDLNQIKKFLENRNLNKGEILYTAGTTGDSMYFLEYGSLEAISKSDVESFDDHIIKVFRPGEFCGEEIILGENGVYANTVKALESSFVHRLRGSSLRMLMADSPHAGNALLLELSKKYCKEKKLPDEVGKFIAFVSTNEGVGKTTLCMNLAEAFHRRHKRVLVIDCDFQMGNAHMHIGCPANPNISMLINKEENISFDIISKYIISKGDYQLLAAPEVIQDSELINPKRLEPIVHECIRNFDFVFLDVRSYVDELTLYLWDLADKIIIVQNPSLSDLTRFKRLESFFTRLNYHPDKFLGIVNKFDRAQQSYLEQFHALKKIDWMTVANDHQNVEEAIFNGSNIISHAIQSTVILDLDSISHKLICGKALHNETHEGVISWFKHYFSGS